MTAKVGGDQTFMLHTFSKDGVDTSTGPIRRLCLSAMLLLPAALPLTTVYCYWCIATAEQDLEKFASCTSPGAEKTETKAPTAFEARRKWGSI